MALFDRLKGWLGGPQPAAQPAGVADSAETDAADTEEGIQRWWLSPACGAPSLDTVRSALQALERRGVIVKKTVIGGRLVHKRGVAPR